MVRKILKTLEIANKFNAADNQELKNGPRKMDYELSELKTEKLSLAK